MDRAIRILVAAVAVAAAGAGLADDKPDRPKADPETTPLELTITGKKTNYTLDTGGLTPGEYRQRIDAALKPGGRPAAAPAVDLAVVIKNTSDKPVSVWVKGDPVVLTLELKGEGAVNADPLLPFTLEFRAPEAVEIAPGKAHTIPVKGLTSGFRGMSRYSYWTAPGKYELVATLKTGVKPAPKGSKEAMDGFGAVTLTSPAFGVTVEKK
jgi:hypothetical protein